MCLSFVTASVFGCAMIDSYAGDGFRPVDSAPAASIQGFQPRVRRACLGESSQIDWQRSSMVRGTDAGLHAAGVCGRRDDPTDDAALHADRIDLQLLQVLPRPLTKKTLQYAKLRIFMSACRRSRTRALASATRLRLPAGRVCGQGNEADRVAPSWPRVASLAAKLPIYVNTSVLTNPHAAWHSPGPWRNLSTIEIPTLKWVEG